MSPAVVQEQGAVTQSCSADMLLCRLPKLSDLLLSLPGGDDDNHDESGAARNTLHNNLLLLGLARLQPAALCSLYIDVVDSWVDNSSAWSTLGKMTQLAALYVDFKKNLQEAVTMQHLSALEPLGSSLQSLVLLTSRDRPQADQEQQQQQQYSFLQALTCLTALSIPVESAAALEKGISRSISGLTRLAVLSFDLTYSRGWLRGTDGSIPLGNGICNALAQLTGLTALQVS
jgi:hypothetical protein